LYERFDGLLAHRLVPGLVHLGFEPVEWTLAAAEADGVVWLIDVDFAPWCGGDRLAFSLAWGVFVPGVATVLDEEEPEVPALEQCVVRGWAGQRDDPQHTEGRDPMFFELRDRGWPISQVGDEHVARRALAAAHADVLPRLRRLADPASVQLHLHRRHISGRGYPSGAELQSIRTIAALSLLLGQRENAARWLDHLAVRSEAAMAPDVVAERLAPLRQRCLAS
jgi:hypothetical protein